MKIVKKIQPKIVIFTAVKNRCILHGRVFVMMLTSNTIPYCITCHIQIIVLLQKAIYIYAIIVADFIPLEFLGETRIIKIITIIIIIRAGTSLASSWFSFS